MTPEVMDEVAGRVHDAGAELVGMPGTSPSFYFRSEIVYENERRLTWWTTVFGEPSMAAAGRLIVAPAGPGMAVERIKPYLEGW